MHVPLCGWLIESNAGAGTRGGEGGDRPPPEPVGASVRGGGKRRGWEGERERKGKEGGNRVEREKRGGYGVEDVSPPCTYHPNYDDSPLDD
jgi:hypothetical protein